MNDWTFWDYVQANVVIFAVPYVLMLLFWSSPPPKPKMKGVEFRLM